MEFLAPSFAELVLACLDDPRPLVAMVVLAPHPFADRIKPRPDVEVITVTQASRERLPEELAEKLGRLAGFRLGLSKDCARCCLGNPLLFLRVSASEGRELSPIPNDVEGRSVSQSRKAGEGVGREVERRDLRVCGSGLATVIGNEESERIAANYTKLKRGERGVRKLVCAGVFLAFAQPLDRGELLAVFPQVPDLSEPVTRGASGAMLAKAANLPAASGQACQAKDVDPGSWYAPALASLEERGIMAGYPDGTQRPGQPVTGAEAAVVVARTLGLFGTTGEPEAGPLKPDHWASSLYNWLVNQGLVSARSDPEGKLTVGEAADFLARVFGSDPQAVDIVEKSGRAQADVKAMRFKTHMEMVMRSRAGMAGQAPILSGSGEMSVEVVFPATMHQVARWRFEATGGPAAKDGQPLPELEMEQYLVGGKMYMKITDPATGKAEWMRLPESAIPDLEALMKESLQASKLSGGTIPEELKPYFHYQLLGTAEKDGRKVFEIGYCGRIDDLAAFFKL